MANNDRKQSSKFVAPRWGAISYVFFLSLLTFSEGTPQKSTKSLTFLFSKKISQYVVFQQ